MTDTTVSEILARGEVSRMQSALDELQVSSYKPLGITINNSLKWDDHITAVQDS